MTIRTGEHLAVWYVASNHWIGMAQIQMRGPAAAPVVPTTAAFTNAQQVKSASSGMMMGVTVNQAVPVIQGSSIATHTMQNANDQFQSNSGSKVVPSSNNDGPTGTPPNQETSNTGVANTKEKTPMCLINELARYNKIQHVYRLTNEVGPAHKKTFTVLLKLGDEEYEAQGLSIKKAQHTAALMALEKTKYHAPPPKPKRNMLKYNSDNLTPPTVELNALAMKLGETGIYTVLEPARHPCMPQNFNYRGSYNQRYQYPRYQRTFYVSLRLGNRQFIGEGLSIQLAKHNAAEKAIKAFKDMQISTEDKISEEEDQTITLESLYQESDLKSPISLVHEIALKRILKVDFEVVHESGPPHMRNFVTRCTVGNLATEGVGNGKKLSKKRAAENMLEELKKLPSVPMSTCKDQKASLDYGQGINPISRLIQIQQAKKEKEPVYTLVAESGMQSRKEFVMQVQVGSNVCTGSGSNKKLAKRAAAEGLLQLLGYSRPQTQPQRPAMKINAEETDKNKKVTFMENEKKSENEGRCGRQLVPGLLLMPDGHRTDGSNSSNRNFQNSYGMERPHDFQYHDNVVALIAKELLEKGSSTTAESITKGDHKTTGQLLTAKQQLYYLANVLGVDVQFTDFPRGSKREYLSLVSLLTCPPHVGHGAGDTIDASHDQAALNTLRALSDLGIDCVKVKKEPGISSCETLNVAPQNGATGLLRYYFFPSHWPPGQQIPKQIKIYQQMQRI
ncbi:hypothetical protein CHUAL_002591 [Chamberlinius hualienensis]